MTEVSLAALVLECHDITKFPLHFLMISIEVCVKADSVEATTRLKAVAAAGVDTGPLKAQLAIYSTALNRVRLREEGKEQQCIQLEQATSVCPTCCHRVVPTCPALARIDFWNSG